MINKKKEVIHINCYKLYLCNIELDFIFNYASSEEQTVFNKNQFLQFSLDSINVNFCILTSILLSEKEEYSIIRFVNEYLKENENKRKVWDILYNYDFQTSWKRIKKLRDKCYAHNDAEQAKIKNEIKLTQKERNIITKGLVDAIMIIYEESNEQVVSFDLNAKPGLKLAINKYIDWKGFRNKEVLDKINNSK